VAIMLGINDTNPQNWVNEVEFVTCYRDPVESFHDLESKPRVYFCRPCPTSARNLM
jgi:hypothetical protein